MGDWDRVWVESRAVHLATRLSGNDVMSGNDITAEMTTEAGSEVKTQHFICTFHGGHLGFENPIQSLLFCS